VRSVGYIIIAIFVSFSLMLLSSKGSAQDDVPFENDTPETAFVLEIGTRQDSISMLDYFDYYRIGADLIAEYSAMTLTVAFIDVPGSAFIEMRTYIGEDERDHAYLNMTNMAEGIAFDSDRTADSDLLVEISGYGNYSIRLEGTTGDVCFICDIVPWFCDVCDMFMIALIVPVSIPALAIAAVKGRDR